MKIAILVTHDYCLGIGKDGHLPWQVKEFTEHFDALTYGRPIIMGRRTYEAYGAPLRGRLNIVLTSDPSSLKYDLDYGEELLQIASSYEEAIRIAKKSSNEVFFVGGASIFARALKDATDIYLNIIWDTYECDTYFPDYKEWFKPKRWETLSSIEVEDPEYYDEFKYVKMHLKRKEEKFYQKIFSFFRR